LLNRFADAQKMMKQMGGAMGLPGRRKATKSPKNKRKGKAKGGNRPRTGGGAPAGFPGGFPGGGMPGGMPQLPPGLDPNALGGGDGLPPGFKLPKIDFNKLTRRDPDEKDR
jgi:signal recognition particle subunit SRP54